MVNFVPQFNVFISSPGDVAEERKIVAEVIDILQDNPILRGKISVRPIAWERPHIGVPMPADLTPQEAINRGLRLPSQCEVVIVIFAGRMGTPFKHIDGTDYLSGTHWELLDAIRASNTTTLIY